MKNPITVVIILLVLWIGGSSYCYVCNIRNHCGSEAVDTPAITPATTTEEIPEETAEETEIDPVIPEEAAKPDPAEEAENFLMGEGIQVLYFEFASSKAVIPGQFSNYADQLKIYLASDPDNKVYVTGHADSRGTPEANARFSRERAEYIRDFLIENGVTISQIVTEAKGDTEPLASNDTEEGRSKNRRVEIKITK